MNKEEKDTRSKILDVAQKLFAKKGFDGTSVREIAKEADVNVAAINYHFKHKSALYWEVHFNSHIWLEEGIASINNNEMSVADLSWRLYEFFIEEGSSLKNAFMMFLSDSTPDIDPEMVEQMMNMKEDFGPPGGQYLLAAVNRELGEDIPLQGRQWAVKSIFSVVMHWALVMSTSHCQEIYKDHPDFQIENKKKFIKSHVEATLQYLKNNPEIWT